MNKDHTYDNPYYIQDHPEYVQDNPKYVRSYYVDFKAGRDTNKIRDIYSIYDDFCRGNRSCYFLKCQIYAIAVIEKKLRAIKKGEYLWIDLYIYEHPYYDLDTLDDRHYKIEGDELVLLKEIPRDDLHPKKYTGS